MVKAEGSQAVQLKTRNLFPVIPKDAQHRKELEEDLVQIGCRGFLDRPWRLKSEEMILELKKKQSSEWAKTNRALPEKWTIDTWKHVYNFPRGGEGMAPRTYKKAAPDKFHNPPLSKDGYVVGDCKNERHKRLLQFLMPILYPERPNRVLVTTANTIFGALSGDRKVFWGVVLKEMVAKMVATLGNTIGTPIGPFFFHLYDYLGTLRSGERTMYKAAAGST